MGRPLRTSTLAIVASRSSASISRTAPASRRRTNSPEADAAVGVRLGFDRHKSVAGAVKPALHVPDGALDCVLLDIVAVPDVRSEVFNTGESRPTVIQIIENIELVGVAEDARRHFAPAGLEH